MCKRILIVTDCSDVAAKELRATIVTRLEEMRADNSVSIEPVVITEPFSVLHGSFLARLMVESYNPSDLTILAVVNPLSNNTKKRARIAGRLKNGVQIVGANTGVFSWLIKDFGIDEVVETCSDGLRGNNFISFGGKYIHAPIAAELAVTGDLSKVSTKKLSVEGLEILKYIPGQVVHIDNFGVAKMLLKKVQWTPGTTVSVSVNGRHMGEAKYSRSMKDLQDGTLAIYPGSSLGLMEIGIVRRLNTAQVLGLHLGDVIELKKANHTKRAQTAISRSRVSAV